MNHDSVRELKISGLNNSSTIKNYYLVGTILAVFGLPCTVHRSLLDHLCCFVQHRYVKCKLRILSKYLSLYVQEMKLMEEEISSSIIVEK